MNTVKESNLGNIKSVFNDNSSNAHYYKIIRKTFGDIIQDLEFAKPIIQVNQGIIIWQSTHNGPYLSYTSLTIQQKQHIDQLIQDSFNEMAVVLGKKNDKNFLDDIIEIPSEESIFYTKDANNTIKVILTEWGYIKDEHIRHEGVLKKIFSQTLKSFIIKFQSSTGELLEGINAKISTQNFNQNYTSNAQGVVKLNNLNKSDTIHISSPDDNFQEAQFNVNTTESYTIIVERNFNLTFEVIDSLNNPAGNTNFSFVSDQFPSRNFQTDGLGFYNLKLPEKEGCFQIFSPENNELLSGKLHNHDEKYTIVYDPPREELEPIIIPEKQEEIPQNYIELEFLNWRRKPIKNQTISLYGKNGKTAYTTDSNGIVTIDSLHSDIEYSVFMKYKGTDWKKDFIHRNEKRHVFIVKMKRFLWWWIPFILFFLLLLLIPTRVTHEYLVLDKTTKQPIQSASIDSSEPLAFRTQNSGNVTDSLGKLAIDYGKTPLYKQIFKKPNTDISVLKSGYESLQTKVPLGYFKTTESIVYLNKIPPPSPIPDPPEEKIILPCGGTNYDDTGNQIKYFDLGKSNSNFLFEYYNDTYLDIITVHCEDGTVLFTVDTTTDTANFQDSKIIFAPCQFIYVMVNGTTNWGIRVNCPK
ncbi:hypothetical protein [Kordia sp.]|uniref:hypothetical protein n=1 Tax=Kordia sp. TaxID=1965332 RepID=UPI003B5C38A6